MKIEFTHVSELNSKLILNNFVFIIYVMLNFYCKKKEICQLTHLPTNRQEFYYPAGRQPGAVILVQNSICYIICISKCRRTKYIESIFFKSRTITTKYFLHQIFPSRRPWAAPADLYPKKQYSKPEIKNIIASAVRQRYLSQHVCVKY